MLRATLYLFGIFNLVAFTPNSYALLNQGSGKVSIQGSLIESACTIDAGSRDQSVDLGVIPISELINNNVSVKYKVSIKLVHCILSSEYNSQVTWKHFDITFDGLPDGNNFRLLGKANGIKLKITDVYGNNAYPGKPLPPLVLEEGGKDLIYNLNLMKNNKKLQSGEYNATVRFKINYF